jgi:outer membrane protein assembly factor BamB
VWRVPDGGRGTPDLDAESVFFLSRRNEIVAVDRLAGVVRWRSVIPDTVGVGTGVHLVATRGVVIAGGQGLVGCDAVTGERRWRFLPGDGHGVGCYLGARPSPDGTVCAGSTAGLVYAVNPRSGTLRWRTKLGGASTVVYWPQVSGDAVAVTFSDFDDPSHTGVALLASTSGRVRWITTLPPTAGATAPRVAGGPLIAGDVVAVSGHDGSIHTLDLQSGRRVWSLPPPRVEPDFRALACAGNSVVAASLSGEVVAYDLTTGHQRWRSRPILASVAFALVAEDDGVFVPYVSGALVALAMNDGGERWRMGGSGAGFRWPPRPDGGRLFLAGSSSGFHAWAES